MGGALGTAYTQVAAAPDYPLRIAPLKLELAPDRTICVLNCGEIGSWHFRNSAEATGNPRS
jgi:hypothetical protein